MRSETWATKTMKRKPDFDLSEEESGDKKQKSADSKDESNKKFWYNIPGETDYSDVEARSKFYPDMEIVSSDDHILKFHRCEMVKIPLFETLISEYKHESGQCKIELKLFDKETINLMLNYLSTPKLFEPDHGRGFHFPGFNLWGRNTLPKLYEIAKYADMRDLMQCCCEKMIDESFLSAAIIECYDKHKLNMDKLYSNLLRNKCYKDEVYTIDFLSQTFDYGIVKDVNGVIEYLLPIYCPSDEQMKKFTFGDKYKIIHNNQLNLHGNVLRTTLERFMNGMVTQRTINDFRFKYIGKENNPKGIEKFIHRLAEICFID